MKDWLQILSIMPGLVLTTFTVSAQEATAPIGIVDSALQTATVDDSHEDIVIYHPEFFTRYQPNTALDMVRQIPGFTVDNGGAQRGFGSDVGNILIDDRRPSTKQDQPSGILSRIPASRVASIELIRGSVRDIDLQGHSEVANVLLKAESPAAFRWSTSMEKNFDYDPLSVNGNISLANRLGAIDYNVGLGVNSNRFGGTETESRFDADSSLTETRTDDDRDKGLNSTFNLNGSTWLGDTRFQFNSEAGIEKSDGMSTTRIEPVDDDFRTDFFEDEGEGYNVEIGVDLERALSEKLSGKMILIYTGEDDKSASISRSLDAAGNLTETNSKDSEDFNSESIARMEFNWGGWETHSINFNVEGAYNVLDSSEFEVEDTGGGPVVVDVPGTDVRVEEIRGDFLLGDTWSVNNLEIELAMAAEASRISQSGDADQVRRFFFLKPYSVFAYTFTQGRKLTFLIEREISQLDFNDFVSSSIFGEDEVALGNPNLRPDTTTLLDLTYEHRLGNEGVIILTGFYRWTSDLLDLIPITDTEEADGNIGLGRRWAIFLEGTLPLDWMGLENAKLNFFLRRRGTSVTDPVTGNKRAFSLTNNRYLTYQHNLDFRQDFQHARMAWGWNFSFSADRPFYRVNEYDVNSEGKNLSTFIESTRWMGIKVRLSLNNILNEADTRRRTFYEGKRDLSPVESYRLESSKDGREVILTLSGSF